jgi:PAS domain S-box-containing protein
LLCVQVLKSPRERFEEQIVAQPDGKQVERLRAELAEARRQIAELTAADRAYRSVERMLDARTRQLDERVKELNCLYSLSHLVERPGVSLDEILQGTAALLPPAWQCPEIACARVVLDGREFRSENYAAGACARQVAEIVVHGRPSGLVEVCYLEERPECDEGPFLAEERSLLDAIAERLGRVIERLQAEQASRQNEERLRIVSDLTSDWAYAVRLRDDGEIQIEWVTAAFTRVIGLSPGEENAIERVLNSIHPEDRPTFERRMAVLRAGRENVSEYRVRSTDGQWRWVRDYARPEWDAERGRVGWIYGASQDITARVEAQAALRQARDQLEERVQERTAALEQGRQRESVLNALLRLSMRQVSLDQHLEQALDEILSIPWLPVLRQGAIMIADQDRVLHMRVQRGLAAAAQNACASVRPGLCLCGRAVLSGEIEFADRVDERHDIVYEGLAPHGQYCVPLLSSGALLDSGTPSQSGAAVLGVLVLYLGEGHRRGAQEVEFLEAIGHTLAGTIERVQAEEALRELNSRLQEYSRTLERRVIDRTREIELRRRVAASLGDILAVLNSDRPLDEVLEHIVAHASRLLGSDVSVVYRLDACVDEEDAPLSVQTVLGRSYQWAREAALPDQVQGALRAGEPVSVALLPDGETTCETGLRDGLDGSGGLALDAGEDGDEGACRALLSVPLVVGDETYGALALFYARSRAFADDEVDLVVAFADQAALAIENARLHERAAEAAIVQERARLARELHDSVTQSLYSLTLLAEGWRRLQASGRLQEDDDPLAEVGQIAQQALKEMRLLVYELRPLLLEEEGLLGALHQRLGAVERRAGIEARLLAQELIELPAPVQECLYGIATEALNNALKHAEATKVTVHLNSEGETVVLEVVDDGVGFEPGLGARSPGMGLQTMRERAEQAGGTLLISSAPGEGTRVVVQVPYGERTHE